MICVGRTAIHIGTTYNIQHRRIHRPASKAAHSTTQNSGVAGRGFTSHKFHAKINKKITKE